MQKQKHNVVEFDNVVKEYSLGNRKLEILHGITLAVKQGEFVSVMGHSGSGKSTTLQLMGCLDKPTRGKVLINGVDNASIDSNGLAGLRARNIGFVFQGFNLLNTLSALENVEIAMAITEVGKAQRTARALELLEMVGLKDRAGHRPSELSGGEQQRVAVARALANEPALLLMDEPTGNLDSKTGEEVMKFISDLWKKHGLTIILVTHEPDVAEYGEKIIRLKDGRVESISEVKHGRKKHA